MDFANPVREVLAIGRESRVLSARRQQARLTAKRWDGINSTSIHLRAEGDATAIRRQGRVGFVEGAMGQAQRGSVGHLPDPDVHFSGVRLIGSVGQELAVAGKSRIAAEGVVAGDAGELERRLGIGTVAHSEPEERGRQQDDNHRCGPNDPGETPGRPGLALDHLL